MYLAGLGLGLSIAGCHHALHQRPMRLDGPVAVSSSDSYSRSAPSSMGRRRAQFNPATVREISSGSIIGKCCSPLFLFCTPVPHAVNAHSRVYRGMRRAGCQCLLEALGVANRAAGGGCTGRYPPLPYSISISQRKRTLSNGLQWAANHGINVIPYARLQKYVTSIDLRSAVQDHVAFKLSFGTTFALAAFMRF